MRLYLLIIALWIHFDGTAQPENALRRRNYNHENGVALNEFDAISYFKGSKPVKGSSNFSYTYKGITYYFSNAKNLEEFKKAPPKYEPAYGGWCAYTMAVDGQRAKSSPVTYKIIAGKLYLFSNFSGNNMLLKWNKNEKKFKESADKFWAKKWGG
jgi:YHS domain-containing protein